jgi:hypothetical protein
MANPDQDMENAMNGMNGLGLNGDNPGNEVVNEEVNGNGQADPVGQGGQAAIPPGQAPLPGFANPLPAGGPPDLAVVLQSLLHAVTALTIAGTSSVASATMSLKDRSFLFPRPSTWDVAHKHDEFLTIQSYLTTLQEYYQNLNLKLDECINSAKAFFPKSVIDFVTNPASWNGLLDSWAEFQSRVIYTVGQLDPLPNIAGKLMNLSFAASQMSLSEFAQYFKKRFDVLNQHDAWRLGPQFAVHLFFQHLPIEYRTKLDTVKSHGVPWPSLVELFTHLQAVALIQGWDMNARYVPPASRASSSTNQNARAPAKSGRTDKGRYCTHCKSSNHNTDTCFVLHPDLKEKFMKARTAARTPSAVPVIAKDKGKRPHFSPAQKK